MKTSPLAMDAVAAVSLHCTEGGSDKVYHLAIVPAAAGAFDVLTGYAGRGKPLNHGDKGRGLRREAAQKAFDRKLREQLGKGYRVIGDTDPAVASVAEMVDAPATDVPRPQLLNAITEAEVGAYIRSDNHVGQQKHDCERRLLVSDGRTVIGSNRRGIVVPIPVAVRDAVRSLGRAVTLDGEAFDTYIVLFDVLADDNAGGDLRNAPYAVRLAQLAAIAAELSSPSVRFVETAYTEAEKRALLAHLRANAAEGIVFKQLDAPYEPGHPNSGGPQVKFKFYKTASVKVLKAHPTKRSVTVGVLDHGSFREVGNVTVKPRQTVVPGDIVEVSYLYAFRGGSLFQPELLAVRTSELSDADCVADQLEYKAEAA